MRKINKAESMEELLTISKNLVDNANSELDYIQYLKGSSKDAELSPLEQGKPIDRIARDLRNLQYAQIKLAYIKELCSDLEKTSWQSIINQI